jgi:hypothetical protein
LTVSVPATAERNQDVINRSIQQLSQGRSNATGTFTLATGAASSTVTDQNCAAGSVVIPIPSTANAATELGNGTMWLSATTNGSFTFTHANSATTGRTFRYAILG